MGARARARVGIVFFCKLRALGCSLRLHPRASSNNVYCQKDSLPFEYVGNASVEQTQKSFEMMQTYVWQEQDRFL